MADFQLTQVGSLIQQKLNADVDELLSSIAYAGGISFVSQSPQKSILRQDDSDPNRSIRYRPIESSLPFTTTGVWTGDDDGKFEVVSGATSKSVADSHGEYDGYTAASVDGMILGNTAGGGSIPLKVGQRWTVDDYYGGATPNNSGVLFFKVVAAGAGVADGGKYINVPGGTFQLEQNVKLPYAVKAWGARGDGVTDDLVSIQNTNDYAVSKGGGRVYFSASHYKYTDTLLLKSGAIHWEGDGLNLTRLAYVNASGGIGISGDSDKNLSMNTYSYCSIKDMSLITTDSTTDPDTYIDYTSFSYSEFDVAITTRRQNASCYEAQGNNGSSPYYNHLRGYLFGGDGSGGTNYTQTGIKSNQGLLGDKYSGSNGANANTFGPFPRCAALEYIVDMYAGNGNMFSDISGESITGAYYKLNDNPLIESGQSTGGNTSTTLKDTNASWGGSLTNAAVKITGGKGVGQTRLINSASSDTMTLIDAWGDIPDNTSTYEVYAGKCVDNKITLNRTEGLAPDNPDFIIAKAGVRSTEAYANVVGSIGAGLYIRDESGSPSNSWFSHNKAVFTERLENPGPNANIDIYVKNSVFGGVALSSSFVVEWVNLASNTLSTGDIATATLDVGGTSAGGGDFTITSILADGSATSMGLIGPEGRSPRNPVSRRIFLNVQTGPNFSATADLQVTWCATIV